MAYHNEDLINLDVFDTHEDDGQCSINSINAADQRPFAQQTTQPQIENQVDSTIEASGANRDLEDNPHKSPEGLSLPRGSDVSPPIHQESLERKLDWTNPALMVVSLFTGVCLAVLHHFYYLWLDGRLVRNSNKQQWALR